MFWRGPCSPLYSLGEQGYMESLSRVRLESYSEWVGCPIIVRVVTVEAGHTHAVLPNLEYSTPVSSPAAPGLTSPQALRSRVLQVLSTSEDVVKCF